MNPAAGTPIASHVIKTLILLPGSAVDLKQKGLDLWPRWQDSAPGRALSLASSGDLIISEGLQGTAQQDFVVVTRQIVAAWQCCFTACLVGLRNLLYSEGLTAHVWASHFNHRPDHICSATPTLALCINAYVLYRSYRRPTAIMVLVV